MHLELDIEVEDNIDGVPEQAEFIRWVRAAIEQSGRSMSQAELSIMVVSSKVSQSLNDQYRNKNKPTNVLSFPADIPEYVESPLLGDLVICAPVLEQEAAEQSKALIDHWAHLTIHGCLHLLGFDHIDDSEAEIMESIEIKVLQQLGISNPYLLNEIAVE
ncbi:rRNA maturation RNase YbeY [Pleionea sediminis]|uniref:rRNA maturation RNase YbeY n=1 Tax=Pleionea sediminis TaxID=2569479 RepID=UPI0011847C80|nr:rRNA maturation RNase YbeY [Pleionea sediminis]